MNICTNLPNLDSVRAVVDSSIEELRERLGAVNRKIFENPELAWEETTAHDTICDFLESLGFAVTRSAYGLRTAFEARSGTAGRTVNFNAEYDALPGIGHACGHNLIATASLTGFIALSFAIKKFGIEAQTQLLGTPAEEADGGKIKLIEAGAYKNAAVSLMAHPMTETGHGDSKNTGTAGTKYLALLGVCAEFHGQCAHAGAYPWKGINALDAAVAAYNNISMLRQQMHPDERVHGCFLDGPKTTNIIPDYTKMLFYARSPTMAGCTELGERVKDCLRAGALGAGCEVTITEDPMYADLLVNEPLCHRYVAHMLSYGTHILPVRDGFVSASTDQGNVMHEIPGLHAEFGLPGARENGPHTKGFTASAGTDGAFHAALDAGKGMALTGWDVLTDDKVYESMKTAWEKEMAITA